MKTTTEQEQKLFQTMKSIVTPEQTVSICGWCPDARERTLALKQEGKIVSHGMCPSCKAKFEAGL